MPPRRHHVRDVTGRYPSRPTPIWRPHQHMYHAARAAHEVYAARGSFAPRDVTSSLGKKPKARYSSATEIIDEVNGIVRSSVKRVESVRPSRRPRRGPPDSPMHSSCRARGARVVDAPGAFQEGPRGLFGGHWGGDGLRRAPLGAAAHLAGRPAARTGCGGGNEMHGLADKAEPAVPLSTAAPVASASRRRSRPLPAATDRARVPGQHKSAASAQRRSAHRAPGVHDAKRTANAPPVRGSPEI